MDFSCQVTLVGPANGVELWLTKNDVVVAKAQANDGDTKAHTMSLVFRETVNGGEFLDGAFELIIKNAAGSSIPAQTMSMGYRTYGPGYPEV